MTNRPSLILPNAGPGPDPFDAAMIDARYLAVYFQRDYYCGNCREQVQQLAERYQEFKESDAEVVSILPESKDRAADWVEQYELPFPVLADEDATVSDAYDQPVRFGILGAWFDLFGRMPQVLVIDTVEDEICYRHTGSSPTDRPSIDTVLAAVDGQ